jgi:hypothetical protein
MLSPSQSPLSVPKDVLLKVLRRLEAASHPDAPYVAELKRRILLRLADIAETEKVRSVPKT